MMHKVAYIIKKITLLSSRLFSEVKSRKILLFFPLLFAVLLIFMSPFGGFEIAHGLFGWVGDKIEEIVSGLVQTIADLILALPALILAISAAILNYTVMYTVAGAGEVLGSDGISQAWTVLRDVSNIAFIGILIWIGISTILSLQKDYKKLLPTLIIIALLINFSLFMTRFVIDISNAFSVEILQLTEAKDGDCDYKNPKKACKENGLAGAFMTQLGIMSFYDTDTGEGSIFADMDDLGSILQMAIMGAVFLLVTAFVFFAASVLLINRFIVLAFLIVLSPLAFAAMILPKTQAQATKWWNSLLNHAFFAPAFFLLVFVVLKIIGGMDKKTGIKQDDASLAQALTSKDVSFMGIILFFVIIIGLLIASLIIARELGIKGGNTAVEMGKGARKKAQGVAVGAGKKAQGFAGRHTVGRGSHKAAESEWMKRREEKHPAMGGGARKLMKMGAGAKFGGKEGGFEKGLEAKKKHFEDIRKRTAKPRKGEEITETTSEAEAEKIRQRTAEREKKFREETGRRKITKPLPGRGAKEAREKMEKEHKKESKKTKISKDRKDELSNEIQENEKEIKSSKSQEELQQIVNNSDNIGKILAADRQQERLNELKKAKKKSQKELKELERKKAEEEMKNEDE